MTLLSKLNFESSPRQLTRNIRQSQFLRWMCITSSSLSALWLLQLYLKVRSIRKSLSKTLKKTSSSSKTSNKKSLLSQKKFLRDLKFLLRILIPSWRSREVGFMSLTSLLLVIRSLCDLWTIYLGTLMESSIISGNKSKFLHHLKHFAMTMPLMSLTNVGLKYSTRQLELHFRSNLTSFLLQKYLNKLTFYKVNQKVRNVDQILTTDVEKLAFTVAKLYSQMSKPLLDILIYAYGITRSLGSSVPGTMMAYLTIAAILITRLRKPMAQFTSEEQSLEGEFRFGNSRIITNCEEISFYKGSSRELEWLQGTFNSLKGHFQSFIAFKVITEYFENFVAKYFATVVGYWAVGRPFFLDNKNNKISEQANWTAEELETRQENYYKSGRMLVNMSGAIGKLVLNAKDISRLAGYVGRISDFIRDLKALEKEENSSSSSPGGMYCLKDNVIKFERVPIVTPNGDVLLETLDLEVSSGTNVLVSGPNGSGKSSLFRILGELWPLQGGILTKPHSSKLFYIPQKPYMPWGTFRDQIIYPDNLDNMRRKGASDKDLLGYLKIVELDWIVLENNGKEVIARQMMEDVWRKEAGDDRDEGSSVNNFQGQRFSWNEEANWMDVLSGGQKQRIAMARLFYHKPQFAILDECTSAVSVDVEGAIYEQCREEGITLFTVTHRKSLWKFHEFALQLDGRGSYSFNQILQEDKE